MQKILFVLPHLEFCSAATSLSQLAAGLKEQCTLRAVTLVSSGPALEMLQSSGLTVELLGWNRVFDWLPFRQLREVVASYKPDVIHTLGLSSLRAVGLTCRHFRGKLVASSLGPREQPGLVWKVVDRWLLRRMDQVVFRGEWEARPWQNWGLDDRKCAIIPPGVAVSADSTSTAPWRQQLQLPKRARIITCIGPMEPGKGLRDTIWTLDILHYLIDTLCLVLVGDGVERPRLEQFARAIRSRAPILFVGNQPSVLPALQASEIVWVPSTAQRGFQVALEAQAAGRPVVASGWPCFTELIEHGVTGFLTPPGDKPALARQSRLLLEDTALRQRVGETASRQAGERYSVSQFVRRFANLYGCSLALPEAPD